MDSQALARLPETIELCVRDLSGSLCRGVIFRPTPDDVYCPRCGGKEAGVRYVRGDADDCELSKAKVAEAVARYLRMLGETHPHLRDAYEHAAANLHTVILSGVLFELGEELPGARS